MPKVSRFERDRIAKLFGHKTKPILKQPVLQDKIKKDNESPVHRKIEPKEPVTSEKEEKCTFKASSYIQMEKVYKVHNRTHQIQKMNFRCFNDE